MTPTLIAVYGTLRTGQHNAPIWLNGGAARSLGLDKVDGYGLVSPHGAFPYAVPALDSQIVVELIEVPNHDEAVRLVDRLDALEGVFNDHYRRVTVTTESGREAFMYEASRATFRRLMSNPRTRVVASGDWCRVG